MQCASCKTTCPSGTFCGFCKNPYCFTCSKITEEEYANLKPYLRAAWKCPSCRGEYAQSSPTLSSLATSGPVAGADSLQEVMRKLNEMSAKLDCIPKLVSDLENLKAEVRELKSKVLPGSKPSQTKYVAQKVNKAAEHPKKPHKKEECGREPTPPPAFDHEPFAYAPVSSFDLSEFKKVYAKEDAYHSISYFWQKFDPDNWSIWHSEYKYPQDLTKVFMSCNLITGMLQKLDKMRKHAFASVCVFGEDNNSSISGVWVWRGHQLIFPLSENWKEDYEYYEWRKLDLRSQETSRVVQDYFSWSGLDSQRRKFSQGKIFK